MPVDYLQEGMAEELNLPMLWTTVASDESVIWTWCDQVWIQHPTQLGHSDSSKS